MFYATQIHAVIGSTVIDSKGRRLRFVGDLPVKVGDTVCTDGSYIFGHAPPKASPAIFSTPSGIPVLASKNDDDLRGYFDLSANFNRYRVHADNWLVNDIHHFAHDSDDDDILDADIANDGSLLTVEKSVSNFPSHNNPDSVYGYFAYNSLMYSFDSKNIEINLSNKIEGASRHAGFTTFISSTSADYSRFDNSINSDFILTLKRDSSPFASLHLSQLLYSFQLDTQARLDFIHVDESFPSSHLLSRAIIKNFKIFPDQSWQALVLAEVIAERGFLYNTSPSYYHSGSVNIHRSVTDTPINDTWWEHKESTNVSIASAPYADSIHGFSSSLVHRIALISFSSDNSSNLIFDKISHFPLFLLKRTFTFNAADSSSFSFYTSKSVSTRAENAWIINHAELDTTSLISEFPDGVFRPIVRDGVDCYLSYKFYRASQWRQQDHIYEYAPFAYYHTSGSYTYDSSEMPNHPDYDNPFLSVNDFDFPIQDGFFARFKNLYQNIEQWVLDSVFDSNGYLLFSPNLSPSDVLSLNLSLVKLRGNRFLFGIHDKQLFLVNSDSSIQQIASVLKNFRLRQLNPITKSAR